MNNQPLNLLTTAVGENGASNSSSSGSQRQADQQANTERQLTLANLFSSLSNLASGHRLNYHQQPQAHLSPIASPNAHQAHQAAPQTVRPTNPIDLSNSLQSVMAAAMVQQQLVNAVNQQQHHHHHHQQPYQQHQPLQAPETPFLADQFSQKIEQNTQITIHHQQQQQQQQQRINYCTICNKELCNKYFMKTHMLKMHKISLEMEQPEGEEGEEDGQGEGEGEGGQDSDQKETEGSDTNENQQANDESGGQSILECPTAAEPWSPSAANSNNNNSNNNNSNNKNKPTKKTGSSNNAVNKKQSTTSKPATSVMNGFAGNSMGGVVCDICNKELCSKYFLKVHKQNTHGVMTDYQDANQFMYPFAFMPGPATVSFVPNPPMPLFTAKREDSPKMSGVKKLRLSEQEVAPSTANESLSVDRLTEIDSPNSSSQVESVYRLILAQQQQQQQQQQLPPTPLPPVPVPQPPVSTQMGMAANLLSALMCFGTMGPASPLSPAVIVDNILRNQHLFNRNNNNVNCTNKAMPSGDRNNNNSNNNSDLKQTTSTKSSSNSRYFSHYTEACPMCDRRFKSIKWLKTHMMNDHKQEIAAYMQMMMYNQPGGATYNM